MYIFIYIASFSNSQFCCILDDDCFDVGITTKRDSSEISWSIGSCISNTYNYGKNEYTDNSNFAQQCCIAAGNHKITCTDSYGDGWAGGYLTIYGIKYCEDFSSGNEKLANLAFTLPGREIT